MPRKSPQKRYADTVHLIAKRAHVSYRTAQRIYRNHKDKYPSHWKALPKRTVAAYRKEVLSTLYDLRGKDRPFAFDVSRRREGRDAETALQESGIQRIKELTLEFTLIVDGEKHTITKTRYDVSVKPKAFWASVHDAAREVVEDETAEGYDYDEMSVVLNFVTVV